MDVHNAVRLAKDYVGDPFAEEGIERLCLEEVAYDDARGEWSVTVGFDRIRPGAPSSSNPLGLALGPGKSRTYKSVVVDDRSAKVLAVRNREVAS